MALLIQSQISKYGMESVMCLLDGFRELFESGLFFLSGNALGQIRSAVVETVNDRFNKFYTEGKKNTFCGTL